MATATTVRARASAWRLPIRVPAPAWPVLASLVLLSLLLRTAAMRAGYWTDESIAIGIASRPLGDIPATLRLDGSPPLYYALLHGWLALAGSGEAATRTLSLLIALAGIPVAFLAGNAIAGRVTGMLAAAGWAGVPFLTQYAQETRMYSLVALLSLIASAAFVLAVLQGRRRHLVTLAVAVTALLYTHTWGIFLLAVLAAAWVLLAWRGRTAVPLRDGALVLAGIAVAFAPWIPSLAFQMAHTGAPWAQRPTVPRLLASPGQLLGGIGAPLLAVAVVIALLKRPERRQAALTLLAVAAGTLLLAWLASQMQPAWAMRYMAVALGPLVLGLALALGGGGRLGAVLLVAVGASWLLWQPPTVKSNVRTVAARIAPALHDGDIVLAVPPEDVPSLATYLPQRLHYRSVAGPVRDQRVTDWRDLVHRIRVRPPGRVLAGALARVPRGGHLVLVTPIQHPPLSPSPLARMERERARQLRALIAADPRLVAISDEPKSVWPRRRSQLRAQVFALR